MSTHVTKVATPTIRRYLHAPDYEPHVDTVTFRFLFSDQSRTKALSAGEID